MNKSYKSMVVFVMVIAVLVIGYFGVYGQWTKLSEAKSSLEVVKAENARLLKAQADITSFISKFNQNRSDAELAELALPMGDERVPNLLDNLSKMATEGGLNLSQVNFVQGAIQASTPLPYSIQARDASVQLTGSYEAFKNFLIRAQRLMRIMDIVEINIKTDEDADAATPSLIFDLTIRTYYQQK